MNGIFVYCGYFHSVSRPFSMFICFYVVSLIMLWQSWPGRGIGLARPTPTQQYRLVASKNGFVLKILTIVPKNPSVRNCCNLEGRTKKRMKIQVQPCANICQRPNLGRKLRKTAKIIGMRSKPKGGRLFARRTFTTPKKKTFARRTTATPNFFLLFFRALFLAFSTYKKFSPKKISPKKFLPKNFHRKKNLH